MWKSYFYASFSQFLPTLVFAAAAVVRDLVNSLNFHTQLMSSLRFLLFRTDHNRRDMEPLFNVHVALVEV